MKELTDAKDDLEEAGKVWRDYFDKAAEKLERAGLDWRTRHGPFNSTQMGVNSISFGPPHVRPMGRTCGEPDEIKYVPTRKMLPLFLVTRRVHGRH